MEYQITSAGLLEPGLKQKSETSFVVFRGLYIKTKRGYVMKHFTNRITYRTKKKLYRAWRRKFDTNDGALRDVQATVSTISTNVLMVAAQFICLFKFFTNFLRSSGPR